ncbi:MAG: hypothetical protein DDT23_01365 [candidate division WS2 bacterium]|nr:hypothetical protein [Candidatus Lithacetigena glycinireducens]
MAKNEVWEKIKENPDKTAVMRLVSSTTIPDIVSLERVEIILTPEIRAEWRAATTLAQKVSIISRLLGLR